MVKWKPFPIKELEDDYQISDNGQVYSDIADKILSTKGLRGGYPSIHIKDKTYKVHQLVAKAFIPNSDPKKIVNHKDGNKLNNNVSNLEWITIGENNKHAIDTGLAKKTMRKIYQYDLDGNIVAEHPTIRGAGVTTGIDSGSIAKCCKGRQDTAGGYKWGFSQENPNEGEIDITGFKQTNDFSNYMINNEGIIYSKPYKKIMKQQTSNDGYKIIQLAEKNKRQTFLVHRLVAMHFIPRIDGKDYVNHKDGNKVNNHVDNLEWVTNSENMYHMYKNKNIK